MFSIFSFLFFLVPLLCNAYPSLLTTRQSTGTDCGAASPGGNTKCSSGQCCSAHGWCGTTSDYCSTGCQSSFGTCGTAAVSKAKATTCSGTSASTGRSVGYYQGLNANTRSCNKMPASQISTSDYTHLIYAFAKFDSSSFEVAPSSDEDIPYYTEFTGLASSSLKTWIAIGGGSLGVASWQAMAASSTTRSTFIASLKSFLTKYKFSGVDLDWEYPSTSDTANLASLVSEMRTALGSDVGISVAFPLDPASLKGYDVAGMADDVDFYNVMAYDMGGHYSADDPKTTAQTDIRTIQTGAALLWASGVDPAKLNLGLAYYGRGYTLQDASSCSGIDCPASGSSSAGSCSAEPGFLTNAETQSQLSQGATSTKDADAMVKMLSWGAGDWLAYDDEETYGEKLSWADSVCMGGKMVWSIDFDQAS